MNSSLGSDRAERVGGRLPERIFWQLFSTRCSQFGMQVPASSSGALHGTGVSGRSPMAAIGEEVRAIMAGKYKA
jgi:hypothetical protein